MTRVSDAEVEAAARTQAWLYHPGGWDYIADLGDKRQLLREARESLEAAARVREEARQARANAAARWYADATRDLPDVPDEPMPKREPSVPLSAVTEVLDELRQDNWYHRERAKNDRLSVRERTLSLGAAHAYENARSHMERAFPQLKEQGE